MMLSDAAERLWSALKHAGGMEGAEDEKMRERGARAGADDLRDLLGSCPICRKNLAQHAYASFAFVPLTAEAQHRFAAMRQAVEGEQWNLATQFDEFDALSDNAVAHAVRCSSGRVAVVIERDPVELNDAPNILYKSILNEESANRLAALIEPGSWRSF